MKGNAQNRQRAIRKIMNEYVDCIVTDDNGVLDIEQSYWNLADAILERMDDDYMPSLFTKTMRGKNIYEWYDYLTKNFSELTYIWQEWIDENREEEI